MKDPVFGGTPTSGLASVTDVSERCLLIKSEKRLHRHIPRG